MSGRPKSGKGLENAQCNRKCKDQHEDRTREPTKWPKRPESGHDGPSAKPNPRSLVRNAKPGDQTDGNRDKRQAGGVNRLLKKVFWSRSAGKIFLYEAISCRQRGITNRSQKDFPLSGGMIWSTLSFSAAC